MHSASAYFPTSTIVSASKEPVDRRLFIMSDQNRFLNGTTFPALVSALWHRQPTGFGALLDVTNKITVLLFMPDVTSILQAVSAPQSKGELAVQVVAFDRLNAHQLDAIGPQFLAMPSFVLVANAQNPSSLSLTIPVCYCSETSTLPSTR